VVLYSGAANELVEVESGFAGSCTGVCVGCCFVDAAVQCSLGPSISRFRCPTVAAKQWRRRSEGIRSSRVLPRLSGALLRCRQRARRGGVGFAGSCTGVCVGRCFVNAAVLVTRFVIGAEMAVGAAVGWQADRPRLPLGVSRWREPIRDLWSLGRVPGRGFFNDDIVPAFVLDSNCSLLKLSGDGAPSDRGGCVSFRRRRRRKGKGTKDLVAIFFSLEVLFVKLGGTAVLCILIHTCTGMCTFP
jgi:hypothetical protein